nr:immunoglobulin light chain junction region [Macaca mulatta]MOV74776.1 immunoglobulin light chain junction region [Macaca mulatta]MOV74815.1 immunoglobulin light chain junction region [Macaca mulatta]MOV74851.1 immunoglobulin light chain junction region [Macaca mulatta]MOV76319.1 immunoglobulin light chain junction region [Macaca mulatta]
CQQYNDLLRTF